MPFRPDAAFPAPPNSREFGIDESLPTYKTGDLTPQFRLKDMFLWNLHESLVTPDQFAKLLVDELDLPIERKAGFVHQIATQIRTQLEEYAGVALHPLFRSSGSTVPQGSQAQIQQADAGAATPQPNGTANGVADGSRGVTEAPEPEQDDNVTAVAEMIDEEGSLNPDDAYRCIVSLNVNIMNKLYTDKFEWSLLHPPGHAETFAKQTCADLGLAPEWVTAIAHAIYEAVLRLKKEACENGGLVGYGELDNDCAEGADAGWRYEPERLGEDWEPKIEILSKEEIDRREGDRERQVRRQRRETARFSSTANMISGLPQADYFTNPDMSDQPMGRGERSKKKRRFRSVSPTARDTPDAGYGGGTGLQEA
jgi:chromatin structure-remodeling complex subunit SFH1